MLLYVLVQVTHTHTDIYIYIYIYVPDTFRVYLTTVLYLQY